MPAAAVIAQCSSVDSRLPDVLISACRSKLIGLQTFQEKAKGVLLEGFARDMQASHEQLEDEIDAYVDRLVQAKVLSPTLSHCACSLP